MSYDWNVTAVVCVIIQKNEVLLIQENEDHDFKWYFPAGRVDIPESIPQAAIREVREEAGFNVEPQELLMVQQVIEPNSSAPSSFETSLRFIVSAKIIDGVLKTHSDEHSYQAAWVSLDKLSELDLRHPKEIQEILNVLTKPGLKLSDSYNFLQLG